MTMDMEQSSRDLLISYISRIEVINQQAAEVQDDKKVIMAEAKAAGFDLPTLREIIKNRSQDPSKIEEREALFDTYMSVLTELEKPAPKIYMSSNEHETKLEDA